MHYPPETASVMLIAQMIATVLQVSILQKKVNYFTCLLIDSIIDKSTDGDQYIMSLVVCLVCKIQSLADLVSKISLTFSALAILHVHVTTHLLWRNSKKITFPKRKPEIVEKKIFLNMPNHVWSKRQIHVCSLSRKSIGSRDESLRECWKWTQRSEKGHVFRVEHLLIEYFKCFFHILTICYDTVLESLHHCYMAM